jgi:hypothetical protein
MAGKTQQDQTSTYPDQNLTKFLNIEPITSITVPGPSGSVIIDGSQVSIPGFTADTAVLAYTASSAPSYLPLVGGTVTGNLTVNGTAYLNSVVSNTSSYNSGSTVFGDALTDTHQFTGSVYITGSSLIWNNNTLVTSNVTSSMSVASASQALTASYFNGSVTSASYATTASYVSGTVASASNAINAITASRIFITNLALDPGTYYPMFANSTYGPVSLFADALTYTYQPSTNILTVTSSLALGVSASSINSNNSETYDSSNNPSINWDVRRLQDSSTNNSLSWEDRILVTNTSATTVDWQLQKLTDESGFDSIDWKKRKLYAEDGTTVVIDYLMTSSGVIMSSSLTVGRITSTPSTEATLNVYPPMISGVGEGGQILLAASGGIYTSASMLDTWQNYFRILRGTNTGGSNAQLLGLDLQTGNLSIAGALIPNAWTAGQVIKDTMLSNTEVTVSTTTIATSTSDTDFVTYSYTPVSSNSYLIIHYHLASYDFSGGTGNDSYFSRIKVDGTEITYARQSTVNGNRSGVLFPITGRYTNSNTTAKSIVVACRRDSADDSITIANTATSMWLRITEIAR